MKLNESIYPSIQIFQNMKMNVNRAFNSFGSNVFFEFGNEQEITLSNGKKDVQKEWIIWISNASWRISKNNIEYIVGSFDNPKLIQDKIQELLGKQFESFSVLSNFFDLEFNFSEGYKITTFFNWIEENQLTLFFPDQTEVRLDCAEKKQIKELQSLIKYPINEQYTSLELPIENLFIQKITREPETNFLTFHCNEQVSIQFQNCTWRIEKDNKYCIGNLDEEEKKTKLSELIGKKINRIDLANKMMDSRFTIDANYFLKTFSCAKSASQWKIYIGIEPFFSA